MEDDGGPPPLVDVEKLPDSFSGEPLYPHDLETTRKVPITIITGLSVRM